MKDVVEQVDRWVARGDRVALATVVGVRRSAPGPPGSKMAINDRGEVYGAVSGGCVEGAVVEAAERVLGDGDPLLLSYRGDQRRAPVLPRDRGERALGTHGS